MVRYGAVDGMLKKMTIFRFVGKRTCCLICFSLLIISSIIPYSCHAASQKERLPYRVRAILYKAVSLMNEKAYDEAIETVRNFEALGKNLKPDEPDPQGYHHARIYFTLGACLLFKGEYDQAVDAFEQAVKKDPTHVSSWLNLAKALYELGNLVQAADCFKNAYDRAVEKDPKHLYYAATSLLMAKETDACIVIFQKLIGAHPDAIRFEWREAYVQALLADNRVEQALPHLRELAENTTDGKRIKWQEILLSQYIRLERWKEAGRYAGWLTEQTPGRPEWWKALAHIHLKEGLYRNALAALTISSYLSPLSESETKLVADLYLQLGIPAKAAPFYETVLSEKADTGILQRLVTALRQLGKSEEALAVLGEIKPDDGCIDLLMVRADLLYELKRYREAGEAYQAVAGVKDKEDAVTGRAWLMAGYSALQIENMDACRNAFKRAAAFASQRKAALLAIKQLDNISRTTAGMKPSNLSKDTSG